MTGRPLGQQQSPAVDKPAYTRMTSMGQFADHLERHQVNERPSHATHRTLSIDSTRWQPSDCQQIPNFVTSMLSITPISTIGQVSSRLAYRKRIRYRRLLV